VDTSKLQDSKTDELKYQTMYANLDRMWKKLPESIVEDLNMDIISLTRRALREYETTKDSDWIKDLKVHK